MALWWRPLWKWLREVVLDIEYAVCYDDEDTSERGPRMQCSLCDSDQTIINDADGDYYCWRCVIEVYEGHEMPENIRLRVEPYQILEQVTNLFLR